jgi:hypothetical protein
MSDILAENSQLIHAFSDFSPISHCLREKNGRKLCKKVRRSSSNASFFPSTPFNSRGECSFFGEEHIKKALSLMGFSFLLLH